MRLQRLCKRGAEWPEKLRAREAASVNLLGMVILAKDEAHRLHTLPKLYFQRSAALYTLDLGLSKRLLRGYIRTSTHAAECVNDHDSKADTATLLYGSPGC